MTIFTLLAASPLLLVTITLAIGLLVGSFLNVVIYRLPLMMQREWQQQCQELLSETASADGTGAGAEAEANTVTVSDPATEAAEPFNLAVPRSRCPHCGHRISALENIPVLSYLFLRGRCSGCNQPIPKRYPLVELATGLLSALIALQFGFSPLMLGTLVLTWVLIALTMIDFDHQLLPDSLTLPLLW
ncbi:MAG: prepilin peptidase, partial [Motiliproteus sp.]